MKKNSFKNLIWIGSEEEWEVNGVGNRGVYFSRAFSRSDEVEKVLVVNCPRSFLGRLGNRFQSIKKLEELYPVVLKDRRLSVVRVSEKLFVLSSTLWFPETFKLFASFERRRLAKKIVSVAERLGLKDCALWVSNPRVTEIARQIPASYVVFDAVDNLLFHPQQQKFHREIKNGYEWARSSADLITILTPNQAPMFAGHPNLFVLPNGVDELFLDTKPLACPSDLEKIPSPRVLYTGVLQERVDLDLLMKVVRALPEYQFVFVGLDKSPGYFDPLKKMHNVHFLGVRKYKEVPAYIKNSDVCIIPHKVDDLTNSMNPLKTYEYLACGMPIVSTPVAGTDDFKKYIYLADDAGSFKSSIQQAIAENKLALAVQRRAAASPYLWETRVNRFFDHLTKRFEKKDVRDSKQIRIAFVSPNNAFDKRSLSGSPYLISKLLNESCGDVTYIHNFRPNKVRVGYLLRNIFKRFTWLYMSQKLVEFYWWALGKKFHWDKTIAVSKYYARQIENQLAAKKCDLIFADKASPCLAYLETKTPIIYHTDSTFKLMENYYPEFTPPANEFSRVGGLIEQRALKRASLVIAGSQWAADSMTRDYGISTDKIRVIPYPASFDAEPTKEDIASQKEHAVCRLLFIGVDWKRKGGDLAVEAVDWLNRTGIPAQLIVCGCAPPARHLKNPHIETVGFLDKNILEEKNKLSRLFVSAHFFILPTRAECCGQVFAEASAYGLPIVATDTGGVSSVIFEGQNGYLLSPGARGAEYGKMIKNMWEESERYDFIRLTARKIYETKLSQSVWILSTQGAIAEVCGFNAVEDRRMI